MYLNYGVQFVHEMIKVFALFVCLFETCLPFNNFSDILQFTVTLFQFTITVTIMCIALTTVLLASAPSMKVSGQTGLGTTLKQPILSEYLYDWLLTVLRGQAFHSLVTS